MKLPFLPSFKKKPIISYFLVLVLRNEKVNAVIFEEIEGKIKVLGEKQEYFSQSIEDADLDELLKVLDSAISGAEASLPENIQTHKTIFGIKDEWAENNQIKKEYLVKLKKACEELELTPIGFLVISQAISHLLQKEEGAPVSAILAEVNKKSVTVTLIRAGRIIETKTSEIHESIPFTVDTLLKHFHTSEILPSRIIVFNGKEDLTQEFIGHSFSKSIPFLHLPQISDLPEGFDARAVLFGAATQMGFEVLEEDISHIQKHEKVEEETKEDTDETPIIQKDQEDIFTENFGFVKDKDIAKIQKKEKEQHYSKTTQNETMRENFTQVSSVEEGLSTEKISQKNTIFSKIKLLLSKTTKSFKKLNIKKLLSIFSYLRKGKMIFLIPIILFIIAIISSYLLLLNATITINIDPKIGEQAQKVTFSTSKSEPEKNIIKGEFVTISEDGEVSTQTTGKKDIGTKAKGTITVFNSLSESKTLQAGTIIKSPNGLEFSLDQSLTIKGVASHSADETVSPEKATINVTATDLGKEYNLPSGTKFNVSSFNISDLVAKNDNPFSGGTKKEITIVSAEDIEKLEKELPKQLEAKARENLSKKLDKDKILLPVFISSTLSKKTPDAKIGDEKGKIKLNGSVEYKGVSYTKNDLIGFSKPLLEKELPSDQKVDYSNIKTSVKDVKQKDDEEIEATLIIKALILPKIDEKKLQKEIKGISFTKAEDIIYKISQISNVDIVLSPNLPLLPKNLPMLEKNIKFVTKIDG